MHFIALTKLLSLSLSYLNTCFLLQDYQRHRIIFFTSFQPHISLDRRPWCIYGVLFTAYMFCLISKDFKRSRTRISLLPFHIDIFLGIWGLSSFFLGHTSLRESCKEKKAGDSK